MKNKAFVCFLVDGPTDISALKLPFEDLFDDIAGDNINIEFRYASFQRKTWGDITSLKGVTPENIEKSIYKYYFREQDKNSDLGWNDLTYIIHIIDLDGTYSKDVRLYTEQEIQLADALEHNGVSKDTLYFDDHIAVRESDDITKDSILMMEERNRRKRQNVEHLLNIEEIKIGKKSVKYKLYYFSSNLDHYLCGNVNLRVDQKIRNSSEFCDTHMDAASLFDYFKNEYSTKDDYVNSWRNVKKANNSSQRGTNVNLLIDKIKNSSLEDWL